MIRKIWKPTMVGVICSALLAVQVWAQQQQPAQPEQEQPAQPKQEQPAQTQQQPTTGVQALRASNVIGMEVRNPADESLGEIEDLMIDAGKGQIEYAALSFGGFLGIGDKLFAVPWDLLNMVEEGEEKFFVIDVQKQKLEQAPGFDKEKWPDISDPQWRSEIDKFYGTESQQQQQQRHRNNNNKKLKKTDRGMTQTSSVAAPGEK